MILPILALKFAKIELPRMRAADQFLAKVVEATDSGQKSQIEALFDRPFYDKYLLEMAGRNGGLGKLKVAMLPAPPGWTNRGSYWVVFHTFEDIEQDHDPVFQVVSTENGFKIGPEILENDLDGWKIKSVSYNARIHPNAHSVSVAAHLDLSVGDVSRAPLFRLNDVYQMQSDTSPIVVEDETHMTTPTEGSIVRAGSLLIPWVSNPKSSYDFVYSGVLQHTVQDVVNDHEAYVTAWWIPSLGRLPFTVKARINGPAAWHIRGEGNLVSSKVEGANQTVVYDCPLAISYPKIIGGLYNLEASKSVNGQVFNIWQLDPVDKARANTDLTNEVNAAAFYEKTLGPLPFNGYECYDSDEYYGIESYSHTLLNKTVTHFISHEMGHSYFGGIVPCAYVQDCWNEGVTQYIDSVVDLKDADHSLENASDTLTVNVPLTKMPVAWGNNNASYWRGCYVMKMLESVMGPENVLQSLRDLIKGQVGKDTTWDSLRPYFENNAGRSLQWFWNQWIDHATFPTLQIIDAKTKKVQQGYETSVVIQQSGTLSPFLMKFKLVASIGGTKVSKVVDMTAPQQGYTIETDDQPTDLQIDIFPYTLAKVLPYKAADSASE